MPDIQPDSLPRDVTFDLLSNPRRRFILSYLRRTDQPVTLNDLAAEIAAWEQDVPVETIDRQERKRVYVSLYQTHVPRLADAGAIDWDEDTATVSLAAPGRDLSNYLATRRGRDRWRWYYLALALFGGLLYAVLVADLDGLAAVPDWLAVGIVVASFATLAAVEWWYARREPATRPRR